MGSFPSYFNTMIYYLVSKGESTRETLTFYGDGYYHNFPQIYMNTLSSFLSTVTEIRSFNYHYDRLVQNLKKTGQTMPDNIIFINIKDEYRRRCQIPKTEKVSRMTMSSKLGINPFQYEPRCPRASGAETATLFEAIYNKLP